MPNGYWFGDKNKIMEAIAMESVVIATEMSLEGFSPQILEHLFISKNIKKPFQIHFLSQ